MRLVIVTLVGALTGAWFAATPAAASDRTDVIATVKQYVDYLNQGDAAKAAALCGPQSAIIDEFPPHLWQGATACSDWWNALVAYDKSNGVTNEHVTPGTRWNVTVTGDAAYVVVPATYQYKRNGKPVTESGAVWTLVLQRLAGGWRVAGWAWAQH